MKDTGKGFKNRVYAIVAQIPEGRVMTYGQIATLCGNPRAARIVGGIAHWGDQTLPWQRVVHKDGSLAAGYPGGVEGHKQVLEAEGVIVSKDYRVDVGNLLWHPELGYGVWDRGDQATTPNSQLPTPLPLVVIVGETASGKSALAMELAKRFNGELICADSWTVYRGFDIGTAKPSKEEQAQVPHHLLDVANPLEGFSAVIFQKLAKKAIADIHARGKLPIMVGGTGLYIDSVLYDYSFLPASDPEQRRQLNTMSLGELLAQTAKLGLDTVGIDLRNKRRVIRLIENNGVRPTKKAMRSNTLIIGVRRPLDQLRARIISRIDDMVEHGFVDEVSRLIAAYGRDIEAMKAPGYRAFADHVEGKISLSIAKERFLQNDLKLAKKQRTWFRSPRYDSQPVIGLPLLAETGLGSFDVPKSTSHSPRPVSSQQSSSPNMTGYRSAETERDYSIQWVKDSTEGVSHVAKWLQTDGYE